MKAQLTTILLFFSIAIFSQSADTATIFDFIVCEVSDPAIYPGGSAALRKFFSDSAIYPDAAYKEGIGGKVMIQFCIDEHGNTKDVTVVKGICTEIDQEALRLVKLMKPWKPASRNGKNVIYRHIQSFTFSLTDESFEKEESKTPSKIPACNELQYF